MGLINNKYVAKFIAGGSAPALPPSHEPDPTASESRSDSSLPRGWSKEIDPTTQKPYYLERSTGRTQWVPPAPSRNSDTASILSGTTAGAGANTVSHQKMARRVNLYLNLPTATEREEIRRKAEARRAEKGEEEYVLGLIAGMFSVANI
jgi:hypothetical protein